MKRRIAALLTTGFLISTGCTAPQGSRATHEVDVVVYGGTSAAVTAAVQGKRKTPDAVGMGSYTMDSHNVQRYIQPNGFVQNEGDIGVKVKKPYKIAYGSIIPKKEECENLLVPVAVSSSHIAFGSIRMEPVFMILGQSAGTAAGLAIDDNAAVQDVDYDKLRKRLIADKQRL